MTLPTQKFVTVLWDDAHSPKSTDMVDANELGAVHRIAPILTAGWLLRDDATGITVACEYLDDNDFRGLTFVPRSLVREVTPYPVGQKPKKRVRPAAAPSPTPEEPANS